MSDAPSVLVTDTRITYRASTLGSCLRRLLASRLGMDATPPPESLQKVFDEGHVLEPVILQKLVELGWVLEPGSAQKEMNLHLGNNGTQELYLSGHIDALGTPPGGKHYVPIDAKAFAQSTMDNFLGNGIEAFPHYAWQMSAYCEGFGTNGFAMPLYNKATKELTVREFPSHPYSYEDIQNRIYTIEEYAADHVSVMSLPCPQDWGCPYAYLHEGRSVDAIPDAATPLLDSYLLAKRKRDTYAKAVDALAGSILKVLPYTDDLRSFSRAGITISVQSAGRRMNTQKVKELLVQAGLDVDEYYTESDPSKVHIVVKEKK